MINSILNKKEKSKNLYEEHIKKGLEFIQGKFYKKAMMQFSKALSIDSENAYKILVDELDIVANSGNNEAALAIGLNLLKDNTKDTNLANKLGNFARELGDYKQAKNLYKHALKVDRNYELSFYNLGAALAKVNRYDEEAVDAVKNFDDRGGYIVPEYVGDSNLIENMKAQVEGQVQKSLQEKQQMLEIAKEKGTMSQDDLFTLEEEVESLKVSQGSMDPEHYFLVFDELIEKAKDNDIDDYHKHLYNKALYALSVHKPDKAMNCLDTLKEGNASFKYLDFCSMLARAQKGDYEEVIKEIIKLLGQFPTNRYYNADLGLIYRKKGDHLLSAKYLLTASYLLEKSKGFYNMEDLMALAEEKLEGEKYDEAMELYMVAAEEPGFPKAWLKIGDINLKIHEYEAAHPAYKRYLEYFPNSKDAQKQLEKIFKFYVDKGHRLKNELKMKPAVENYQKALKIKRDPAIIEKAASIYKHMKKPEKEKELLNELAQIKEDEQKKVQEARRQKLLEESKEHWKKRNFQKTIELLEAAFRLRVDKEVFMQLASIYKKLKKNTDLNDLVIRWNRMVEHEEKMKKFKKIQEREQQSQPTQESEVE